MANRLNTQPLSEKEVAAIAAGMAALELRAGTTAEVKALRALLNARGF